MVITTEYLWFTAIVVTVLVLFFLAPVLDWISDIQYNNRVRKTIRHIRKTLPERLDLNNIVVLSHEPHLSWGEYKYVLDEIYVKLGKGVFGEVSFEMFGDQLFVSRDVEMYKNSFRGFIGQLPLPKGRGFH